MVDIPTHSQKFSGPSVIPLLLTPPHFPRQPPLCFLSCGVVCISCKGNSVWCGPLRAVSFTQHNCFEIHPRCSVCINSSFIFIAEPRTFEKENCGIIIYLRVNLKWFLISSTIKSGFKCPRCPVNKCVFTTHLLARGCRRVQSGTSFSYLSHLHLLRVVRSLSLMVTLTMMAGSSVEVSRQGAFPWIPFTLTQLFLLVYLYSS